MDFLSSIFDPQNYAGVTGLLNRMGPAMSFPTTQQPAAFGLAGPAAMQPPAAQPAPTDNAQLPANAAPTSGQLPLSLAPAMPSSAAAASADSDGPLGFLSGLRGKINDNSNMLLGLAAGIAGGKNWGDGISKGLTLAMTGGQLDTKQGNSNRTQQFLIGKGMDPETARAVASDPTLLRSMLPQLMGTADKTNDVKNFEFASKNPAFAAFLEKQKNDSEKFGLSPMYGVDANGNPVAVQLSSKGGSQPVQLPEGVTISKSPIKMDTGTEIEFLDPITRQVVRRVPKDLAGAEAAKAKGKIQGQVQAALPGDISNADQTVTQIDQILGNKGLPEIVGPLDQFRPSWTMSDSGRDALARYNQLKGKAFLQAYSTLRGGGQITEVEGAKAENAMARMDRAQSEDDFKAALGDFRDAVRTGIQKLKEKAGVGTTQGQTAGGVSWSVE